MMANMRIKMIVPVPLPEAAIAAFAAQMPAGLVRDGISIDFTGIRAGTTCLDSLFEATMADAFCLEAGIRAEQEGYDAICLNSMSDSGLAALRSRLSIPVTGPGRSSFLLAADLGKRFSVITMWPRWNWIYDKLALETGTCDRMISVRSIGVRPDTQELLSGKEDFVFGLLEEQCRKAIDEDDAHVIILGSTTMHQSHEYLNKRFEVPIINPGLVAYKQCEMMLDLGLSHSKRTYMPPERPADNLLSTISSVF